MQFIHIHWKCISVRDLCISGWATTNGIATYNAWRHSINSCSATWSLWSFDGINIAVVRKRYRFNTQTQPKNTWIFRIFWANSWRHSRGNYKNAKQTKWCWFEIIYLFLNCVDCKCIICKIENSSLMCRGNCEFA